MPPLCTICSNHQPYPLYPKSVYHRHSSAKEVRIMAGVEYDKYDNPLYLCPTCQVVHSARLSNTLNICLGDSMLHDFHIPKDQGISCPPDSSHVDWVTIPGGKISDLTLAWYLDYHHETRPMRVLCCAGINNLLEGGTKDTVMADLVHMKQVIDTNNRYHPRSKNEFTVATLINPPKLVWYDDNGSPPPNHVNKVAEVRDINDEIMRFNNNNGMLHAPRFQMLGVRTSKKWSDDGSWVPFKTHRWNQWRHTEPVHDKVHLSDQMRVKMGQAVVKYLEGEQERAGDDV